MSIIYIDFERDNSQNIIEIGALHTLNNKVENEFHCLIRREIFSIYNYYRCAENSHCISPNLLHRIGINENDAILSFRQFMEAINGPIIIKGYGVDVNEENLCKLFPFLSAMMCVTYEQVHLLPWHQRQFDSSHISTMNMKTICSIVSCNSSNHSVKYFPTWQRSNGSTTNHSKIAKLPYGFHCALFDCYELAFFDKKLEKYCCDAHFEDNINYNNETFVYIDDEIGCNPLIANDPLAFID